MLLEKSKYKWQQTISERSEIDDIMKKLRKDDEDSKK